MVPLLSRSSEADEQVIGTCLMQKKPDLCIFLSPHKNLLQWLMLCLNNNLPVITSGMVPQADKFLRQLNDLTTGQSARWAVQDLLCFDPHMDKLQQAMQEKDFGQPVYYREINAGGPSLLSNWWRLCYLYDKAEALFGSPIISSCVSASRHGKKIQLALTVKAANNANGHMISTNSPYKSDGDILLIGTGGVIVYDGLHNRPGIFTKTGFQSIQASHDQHILPIWQSITEKKDHAPLPPEPSIHIHNRIWRAIHHAIRNKRISIVTHTA